MKKNNSNIILGIMNQHTESVCDRIEFNYKSRLTITYNERRIAKMDLLHVIIFFVEISQPNHSRKKILECQK